MSSTRIGLTRRRLLGAAVDYLMSAATRGDDADAETVDELCQDLARAAADYLTAVAGPVDGAAPTTNEPDDLDPINHAAAAQRKTFLTVAQFARAIDGLRSTGNHTVADVLAGMQVEYGPVDSLAGS